MLYLANCQKTGKDPDAITTSSTRHSPTTSRFYDGALAANNRGGGGHDGQKGDLYKGGYDRQRGYDSSKGGMVGNITIAATISAEGRFLAPSKGNDSRVPDMIISGRHCTMATWRQ